MKTSIISFKLYNYSKILDNLVQKSTIFNKNVRLNYENRLFMHVMRQSLHVIKQFIQSDRLDLFDIQYISFI